MRTFFQILAIFIVVSLAHSNIFGGVIDFSIIFLWVLTWLSSKERSLFYAIGMGLAFDLLSFLPFGFWTAINIGLINGIDYLKNSFLTVSSFLQALAVLAVSTIVTHLLVGLLSGEIGLARLATSVIANVTIGAIVYYFLATRLKMIQRWTGRIL